ncbi:subtilisin-like protein [Coniophora puteana RWD-64-598 SS2]|uniref:tripeptidyl-peptidase II n=1 Tax=Coniophora puteana (strain RWD-64-598) TaxID=741705 RepID=R7SCT8_CONPW|nr:subtilisin-like protein [Coniophora puteana RWD-64-598 SS2]EIW73986.1 subtilisin-like protein [Coniophora puteana RWD-64-598 SS2]
MKLSLLLGLVGASLVNADVPAFRGSPFKLKESISAPSTGWVKGSAAQLDTVLTFQIGLSRPRFGELEQNLMEISDPSHARYGVHLSKDDVLELMAPQSDTQEVVAEWLALYGLNETSVSYSSAKDAMTLSAPVRVAESMFNTSFYVYSHADSGDSLVRTTQYSLPEVLDDHIALVQPLVMLASLGQVAKPTPSSAGGPTPLTPTQDVNSTAVDPSCNYQITPDCLRQLYNIGNYTPSANGGSAIAVSEFENEWANFTDYDTFLAENVPSAAAGSNFSIVSVTGGVNNQSEPGGEASLDVQYAFGLTRPLPATFYTVGGSPYSSNWTFSTGLLDLADFLLNQTDLPPVISTSYGEDETTVTSAQANRICQGFAALGARGMSVLFSSGDYGVGYPSGSPVAFTVHFPASCPYVTSVGMTTGIHEVAGNIDNEVSSGGGFSTIFPRPSYQDEQVSDYLTYLGDQYSGLYNSSGRGYPDVSAQGINFLVEIYGYKSNETGTSASVPTFAGVIALLNDARSNAGKSTLGFLNPWLYSSGYSALNDITEGTNPGAGTNGFNATKGWDPLTGLGTPDFAKLQALVLA